jgi:flavin reductase (DIM6/NTAB) family NADH-FMN oxidoreductase RutF
MPITKEEFRNALSRFASGVTVVTTKDNDGNFQGLTVSAFCSVSLEPPLILVCIDKETVSYQAFEESGSFVVNILSEKQQHISNQFASPIANKFAGIEFSTNGNEIPILKDALVNLECSLKKAYDGGDHTIFVGEIERSHISEGNPLVYCHGQYREIT